MNYHCPHCDARFSDTEANTVVVPDDRDQMYDRPLTGTREVLCCPECGHIEIEENQ
jgi:DNA-directed RNA polymerase subunit RPC12/RpoP